MAQQNTNNVTGVMQAHVWYWRNNDGKYSPFSATISAIIESLEIGCCTPIQIKCNKKMKWYSILKTDALHGFQQNMYSNFKRKITKSLNEINDIDLFDYSAWFWQNKKGKYVPFTKDVSLRIETLTFGESMVIPMSLFNEHKNINDMNQYLIYKMDEFYATKTNLDNKNDKTSKITRNLKEINYTNCQYEFEKSQQKQYDKKEEKNKMTEMNEMKCFDIPSFITQIKPKLSNITMKEVNSWVSPGRFSFKQNGHKIHSAGHVAILYYNENDQSKSKLKRFEIAFHQRSMRLGGEIAWPGGIADYYGESIQRSVLRELKEECMSKTYGLNENHLHLISCKKTNENPMHIYAKFVLFVNDKKLITGPDWKNERELQENKYFNMTKQNGYHNFFSVYLDPISDQVVFENKEIVKRLWKNVPQGIKTMFKTFIV